MYPIIMLYRSAVSYIQDIINNTLFHVNSLTLLIVKRSFQVEKKSFENRLLHHNNAQYRISQLQQQKCILLYTMLKNIVQYIYQYCFLLKTITTFIIFSSEKSETICGQNCHRIQLKWHTTDVQIIMAVFSLQNGVDKAFSWMSDWRHYSAFPARLIYSLCPRSSS